MAKKKDEREQQIVVSALAEGQITFHLIGTSPLIMNRFQQKAWRELLFPGEQKNRAERSQTMKHIPLDEFRGSVYRNRDDKQPTMIHLPQGAMHQALASAALDMPGAKKAQIERLTKVCDLQINLFGLPQLYMAMVRNSGIDRTPDVRTRAIFPEWACELTVSYIRTALTERTIGNLFGGAGMIVGIGDWRPQKGGPFGTWRLVDKDDADYRRIVKTQARVAQMKALEKPACYDADSEELMAWFDAEVIRREREEQVGLKRGGGKGKGNGKGASMPTVPVVTEDRSGNIVT